MFRWPKARPTPRGWCAIGTLVVLAVVASVTNTPELAPLIAIMALPLAAGPWMAGRRARRLRTSTVFHAHLDPPIGAVGSTMVWVLAVTDQARGDGPHPPAGLLLPAHAWRDRGGGSSVTGHRRWLAPSVPDLRTLPAPGPGATGHLTVAVPTSRRGCFETGPLTTWCLDTFGLFGAPGPPAPGAFVAIHPVPVAPAQVHATMGSGHGGSTARHARRGSELGDLEGIRPYVAGDRLSLVHWPARARYGAWYVRQFGAEDGGCVALVIDDRAGVHRRDGFERMASCAMWLVEDALRSGSDVTLDLVSGAHHALGPGLRGLAVARRVLADIAPRTGRPTRPVWKVPAGSLFVTTSTGALRPPPDQRMQVLVSDAVGPLVAVGPVVSATP